MIYLSHQFYHSFIRFFLLQQEDVETILNPLLERMPALNIDSAKMLRLETEEQAKRAAQEMEEEEEEEEESEEEEKNGRGDEQCQGEVSGEEEGEGEEKGSETGVADLLGLLNNRM